VSVAALDNALERAGEYDWIVFTSPAGVNFAFERVAAIGIAALWLAETRVAAVGPATAAALDGHGVGGAVVPDEYMGDRIPAALGEITGRRFLLLRSDRAADALPERLRALGGMVAEVIAYRTVPLSSRVAGAAADDVRAGVDAVTFTSPSTVEGFVNGIDDGWRGIVERAIVAAIGPVTSGAARAAGMRVDAEADPHTMGGLIDALVRAFSERAAEHRT
jgi:uroporphyrinogen-III synthase